MATLRYPAKSIEESEANVIYAKTKVEESLHENYNLRLHTQNFPIEGMVVRDALNFISIEHITNLQEQVIENGWRQKLGI